MEWISVKDRIPEKDCTVYVTNSKCGVHFFMALYRKRDGVFIWYNNGCYDHPALEVTHWFELPQLPPEDYKP